MPLLRLHRRRYPEAQIDFWNEVTMISNEHSAETDSHRLANLLRQTLEGEDALSR